VPSASLVAAAVHGILSLVKNGDIQICPIMPDGSGRILDLMKKYADIMDFGDATLAVLSEMHPRARLITVDRRDFSFYRRHDGSAVPTIMPDVE
jgi:predicted nucleic acid-binding protein